MSVSPIFLCKLIVYWKYCSINVFISLIFKDAFDSSQNLMKINKYINSMTTEVFSEIFSPNHKVAGE